MYFKHKILNIKYITMQLLEDYLATFFYLKMYACNFIFFNFQI